jgi:hypothetical protein
MCCAGIRSIDAAQQIHSKREQPIIDSMNRRYWEYWSRMEFREAMAMKSLGLTDETTIVSAFDSSSHFAAGYRGVEDTGKPSCARCVYRFTWRAAFPSTAARGAATCAGHCARKPFAMSKPVKTEAELIAMAKAELKAHAGCPDGIVISMLRSGNSWEFRASADAATAASPGYPECVAMLVQVGDHLARQYDLTE